ncbi:core histone H2A/H2B/H3/H4 [Dictyocaulus viviparus]|uniref:Core histone H2A/H2B/H3/H4 n=1 Tax=Dictyocaulus viviparus TaxID=29172 RepID=A0A0D8XDB6_DICVI|nr:core histone H2A/H2B/H3/H4 [Dictyocaulus viviparus]
MPPKPSAKRDKKAAKSQKVSRTRHRRKERYSVCIYRVLKQMHPDTGVSSKAMSIMNSFVNDVCVSATPINYHNGSYTAMVRLLWDFWTIFGRQSSDKSRIVAKANIGITRGEQAFFRQGSLRIPSQQHVSQQLIRYGSLRAPHGSSEHAKIADQLDHFPIENQNLRSSVLCEATGSTWPKSIQLIEEHNLPLRRRLHRPSVFPLFTPQSHANHSATEKDSWYYNSLRSGDEPCKRPSKLAPQPSEILSTRCGCSTPSSAWSPRSTGDSNFLDARLSDVRFQKSPASSTVSFSHTHRVSAYNPTLPEPPPYPGPRDESTSSLLSSSNSIPYPSTTPSETLLSGSSNRVRRVCLSKEDGEYGLGLENSNGGVMISSVPERANGLIRRGDRLLDIGGINMRSADKDAASKVLTQYCASHDENGVILVVKFLYSSRRILVCGVVSA